MDLSGAIFTDHALEQMARRQLNQDEVRGVLNSPEEVLPDSPGRVVAQGMVGQHLFRVFVDTDRNPPEVVTVYRTSQIAKYRSQP